MDALLKMIEACIFARKKAGRFGLFLALSGGILGLVVAIKLDAATIWTYTFLAAAGVFVGTGIGLHGSRSGQRCDTDFLQRRAMTQQVDLAVGARTAVRWLLTVGAALTYAAIVRKSASTSGSGPTRSHSTMSSLR